jgi:beta-glucosidase
MPFYSIAKGATEEEVGAGYNKEIITGMLRDRFKFEGIICTDWGLISDRRFVGILFKPASAHGVEHLNTDERIIKIIDAGVDMIGGESLSEELVELILNGKIEEKRIDQSLKRIMRQKFQLGLFDNPYLTKENANALDNKISIEKGKEAQRKALVLLKNDEAILPLKPQTKIYLHGFNTKKVKNAELTSLEKADVIVAKVETPNWGGEKAESIMELLFNSGRLDFSEEELDILIPLLKTKPTILVANLKRPAVLSQLEPFSKAIIADFDVSDDIIFELILGGFNPSGNLPIQLPSSMKSVLNQKEDLPYDLEKPLYDYGHGLRFKNLE